RIEERLVDRIVRPHASLSRNRIAGDRLTADVTRSAMFQHRAILLDRDVRERAGLPAHEVPCQTGAVELVPGDDIALDSPNLPPAGARPAGRVLVVSGAVGIGPDAGCDLRAPYGARAHHSGRYRKAACTPHRIGVDIGQRPAGWCPEDRQLAGHRAAVVV